MWTAEELRALLPDPVQGATEGTTLADVFMHHYGVEEAGNVDPMKVKESKDLPGALMHGVHRHGGMAEQPQNTPTPPRPNGIPVCLSLSFQDPHQELKGKNVLISRCSPELTAARFGLEPAGLSALLQECRHRLSSARALRPRPHLDTKMLAAWNGERRPCSGGTRLGWTPTRAWRAPTEAVGRLRSGAVWKQLRTCKPWECQVTVLALFPSPAASREQQNSSPVSVQLLWLGCGEGV